MPNAFHIAFVCPRFSETATVGGAETLLKNLAVRAAAAGRKVTFLTTCAENHFTWENTRPPGRSSFGGLEVIYFPVNEDRDIDSFLRIQTAISNGGAFSEADEQTWIDQNVNSRALEQHLREQGAAYDRIVLGPYLFGLIWHAAQIHPRRSVLVPCLHDEPFAHLSIMKPLFERVAGFMFNSEPERDLARRLFNLPPGKCAVVGMGLDPFEADGAAFRARRRLETPYVLYAGRREPLKGTPLLIDYLHAFRERTGRDVKLVLTGSGPIDAPAEMAPHVIDLGFVPEEEKHAAMAGATAFIHPSVNESFGIVLLESWLARTPALVHAKSEVLRWQARRSGAGLWFKTYPEFEEELLLLLEQPDLRARMGEAGRAYVLSEYRWDQVEKRLLAALDGGYETE
jgi:glycosyltransferase involved in cell wall biosynthesis